jgi:hypothetical protein
MTVFILRSPEELDRCDESDTSDKSDTSDEPELPVGPVGLVNPSTTEENQPTSDNLFPGQEGPRLAYEEGY